MNFVKKVAGLALVVGTTVWAGPLLARTINVPATYPYISLALRVARSGDHVRVQPGVYHEWGLYLTNGVILEGATEEPGAVTIVGNGGSRVLLATHIDTLAVAKDLTITGGNADGITYYDGSGGGMLINDARVKLVRVRFTGNNARYSGGGLRLISASPTLVGCEFLDNTAGDGGGGLDCSYDASPMLESCTLRNNSAAWGGGISIRSDSAPTMMTCAFVENTVLAGPGLGGGLFSDSQSHPSLVMCMFNGNKARYGGALAAATGSSLDMTNCTLRANAATREGGGVYVKRCIPNIVHTIIAENEGVAVHIGDDSLPQFNACDIWGNSGGDWLGAIAGQSGEQGNMSADPLFCSDTDLHIDTASPCAPAQNDVGLIGANLPGCSNQAIVVNDDLPVLVRMSVAPNPCNPVTSVNFDLDTARRVRLTVYDVSGRRVRTLADQTFPAGTQSVLWDGHDDDGRALASGTYVVAFAAQGKNLQTTKVLLVK